MTSFAKTVAIIGAGPSGLAAAKALLHDPPSGTFIPTIFEKLPHVGGLWPTAREDYSTVVHPQMPTNASKHIVGFSDLSWASTVPKGDMIPTFPKAYQVGRYLQAYADRYIPQQTIRLSCEVIRVLKEPNEVGEKWKVEWRDVGGNHTYTPLNKPGLEVSYFDYVIIASGFFANPWMTDLPGLESFDGKLLHSTRLDDIDDVIIKGSKGRNGGNVVVIGGSFSGGEAATALAFHLSSNKHSPLPPSNDLSSYTVHHLATRPFWSIPPYCPVNPTKGTKEPNPRPSFIPFDLIVTDLTRRPKDERSFVPSSTFSPKAAETFNEFLTEVIGSNQAELGDDSLAVPRSDFVKPPWVIISTMHAEFVRSHEIDLTLGRVTKIGPSSVTITAPDSQEATLEDVVVIVMATGFSPHPALSFLDDSILKQLSYQPDDLYAPLSLYNYSTMHPDVPSLGFVGFYRGAYWGVIEQQARFLAALWSGSLDSPPSIAPAPVTLSQRGQFPMGDYIGLMESFSDHLGIKRLPISKSIGIDDGPATPSRYVANADQNEQQDGEVASALESLAKDLANPVNFIAPAVFRALQGSWNLVREIKSFSSHYPSGKFVGEAHLYPRAPTEPEYAAEYLYVEKGKLTTENGLSIEGWKSYVYRLSAEEPQKMSCWFVKSGAKNKEVDYIFHEIAFESEAREAEWGDGWRAKGEHHLCVEDHYDTEYWFRFRGIHVPEWGIGYVVKGPKKNYSTKATYTRK
ncbi:FAD/NAD(P)-binding domain-containing protein [Serendipita vermifera]|nr:FAD/NAD(P)-binding domain-containing protein [Serendipita vermifera]